jgi:hypothetical protein
MKKGRMMSCFGSSDTCEGSLRRRRRSTTRSSIRRRSSLSLYSWLIVLLSLGARSVTSQEQNPLTMNGGSVLAMAGKECVALAVDKRFAIGPQVRTQIVGRTALLSCGIRSFIFDWIGFDATSPSHTVLDQLTPFCS